MKGKKATALCGLVLAAAMTSGCGKIINIPANIDGTVSSPLTYKGKITPDGKGVSVDSYISWMGSHHLEAQMAGRTVEFVNHDPFETTGFNSEVDNGAITDPEEIYVTLNGSRMRYLRENTDPELWAMLKDEYFTYVDIIKKGTGTQTPLYSLPPQ